MPDTSVDPMSVIAELKNMLSESTFALAIARARIAQLEAALPPVEETSAAGG